MTGSSGDFDEAAAGGDAPAEPRPAFWVRIDDVMSCIAGAYEQHLGRQASFAEVKARYDALVAGAELAVILGSIATSEEARLFATRRDPVKDIEEAFAIVLRLLYRSALGREASAEEIVSWYGAYTGGMNYGDVVRCVCTSREAKDYRRGFALEGWSDGVFAQLAFEIVLGQGASAREVAHWSQLLSSAQVSRSKLLMDLFQEAAAERTAPRCEINDTTTAWLYGRPEPVTSELWARKRTDNRPSEPLPAHARFPYVAPADKAAPLVSIITSLYGGGRYIDAFLDNIMGQSIFADCELIIVDAASPDGEREKIEAAARGVANIVYMRLETRIGIYAAWNLAVARARGRFLTNANLDDCRRCDSLEVQAATLQNLPFVDIVHQDVFFSLEPNLSFEAIAAAGFKTLYPNANAYSLIDTNSPHNAPMWRHSLHEDIGQFDESLASAADFDFWLRCAARGKRFYKLNDPHVGYFYNPHGISTRADTVGLDEGKRIIGRHARSLVAPELAMSQEDFDDRLRALGGAPSGGYERLASVHAALLGLASADRSRDEAPVA